MVGVIVVVIVEWLALWSFGSDVGGGDLVVVGGRDDRGCGDGGVVGIVVKESDVGGGDLVVVGSGGDRGCGDGGVVGVVVKGERCWLL